MADFDRTLTKGFYEGKAISSIASFLYEDGTMPGEYQNQGKKLFDHYYPIEVDHTIDAATKKAAMDERRERHLDILISYKLSINDIEKIVVREELQLRESTDIFFKLLATHHVPTVIMSASGIGYDSIGLFLEKQKINQKYIDIISNAFIWNEHGHAVGRKNPVIHSMNKSEVAIRSFSDIYKKIAERKNVILLGDSLHDVDMIDGFGYDICLTIGFCNTNKKETIDLFSETFDIVILHDGSMRYPLELLEDILQ